MALNDQTDRFIILTNGHSSILHLAERAVLNVSVNHEGADKATVAAKVLASARRVESLIQDLNPNQDNDEEMPITEIFERSAISRWNQTSINSTSFIPFHEHYEPAPSRVYRSVIDFDVRFKDFDALGSFGASVLSLPHVDIRSIQWLLMQHTIAAHQPKLRLNAARDATQKAAEYYCALGCPSFHAVKLTEGVFKSDDKMNTALQDQQMQLMLLEQQHKKQQAQLPNQAGTNATDFAFRPQSVEMSLNINVEFHATPVELQVADILQLSANR